MIEKPRDKDPKTDLHVPADRILGIGIEDSDRCDVKQPVEQATLEEEMLGFFEGNPGGCPCPHTAFPSRSDRLSRN